MKALGNLVVGVTISLANLLIPQPVNFLRSIGRAASAVAGDPQAARSWNIMPILMITPDRWPDDLAGAPATLQNFINQKMFGIDDYGVFTETGSRLAAKVIGEELCEVSGDP